MKTRKFCHIMMRELTKPMTVMVSVGIHAKGNVTKVIQEYTKEENEHQIF